MIFHDSSWVLAESWLARCWLARCSRKLLSKLVTGKLCKNCDTKNFAVHLTIIDTRSLLILLLQFSPTYTIYLHDQRWTPFSSNSLQVLPLSWTWPCACVELARGECDNGGGWDSSMRVTSYPAVEGESPGSSGSPGEFGLRSPPGSGLIREWLTSSRNMSSST